MRINATNGVRSFLIALATFGALFGPWWLPIIAVILLSIRFRAWEVLCIGLVCDFLWLPSGAYWPYLLFASIIIVWAFEPLRNELLLS